MILGFGKRAKGEALLHRVSGLPLKGPYPDPHDFAVFAMGCFWAPEKLFWSMPGVRVTATGYTGGQIREPTYVGVSGGYTGHVEAALVVFDPKNVSYDALLKLFWENHDPTRGEAQGFDRGRQYRSMIFTCSDDQNARAQATRTAYQRALTDDRFGLITTEIRPAQQFWFAEPEHQQYLAVDGNSCAWHGGTGVELPD